MNTLHFEKISKYDRPLEPVSFSLPFRMGHFTDSHALVLSDGEAVYPVQHRILSRWPDESAKWVIAHSQVDLPGNRDKTLSFEARIGESPPRLGSRVLLEKAGRDLRVDTGPLKFTLSGDGYLPISEVVFDGLEIGSPFGGFRIRCGEGGYSTHPSGVEFEVEEPGPLVATVNLSGKHRSQDGGALLDFEGHVRAYAGKPYLEVEHRFINREPAEAVSLEECRVDFTPDPTTSEARVALGEGYYKASIQRGAGPLERVIDGDTILFQSYEHYVDSFYGDLWADWRGGEYGMGLSVYQAHQNFPKKLGVDANGISCHLYPEEAGAILIRRGVAKTHRVLLHFHRVDCLLSEISARSLQFQLPDRPSLSRQWFRENNPWGLEYFPEAIPAKLITRLIQSHDGRPQALGMLHFGDSPDAGYTDQGRGRGQEVWVNNEYDRPHACTLFYGLTGLRRALDSGLVSARHWLDVDLCHHSDDPLINGGLMVHSAHHVTAGVTPSHEWVDGFLDYYYLTGRREGLDAAHSVARNIMRHLSSPAMQTPGETSTRENGWALRAMVAIYLATGEEDYRNEARRIVELFVEWYGKFGGLLAPYTDHSMPRVVFMNAITGNSLAHYLSLEDCDRVRQLIVQIADDLVEHCRGPDGVFFYKELPSLRTPSPSPHVLKLLAHAYRITGDEEYLRIATRQFAVLTRTMPVRASGPKVLDESGAVIRGHGGARGFAASYTSFILFAAEAARLGLLAWYEYPA